MLILLVIPLLVILTQIPGSLEHQISYQIEFLKCAINSKFKRKFAIRGRHQFIGELVSFDDKQVSLYNSWGKKNSPCSFKMLYIGQSESKIKYTFNIGTKIGIKSYLSTEYGKFRILLDGIKIGIIELNKPLNQVLLEYHNSHLDDIEHSLVIHSIDKFNIDSFIYGPDMTPVVAIGVNSGFECDEVSFKTHITKSDLYIDILMWCISIVGFIEFS